jgi:hypothetical protein
MRIIRRVLIYVSKDISVLVYFFEAKTGPQAETLGRHWRKQKKKKKRGLLTPKRDSNTRPLCSNAEGRHVIPFVSVGPCGDPFGCISLPRHI